MAVDGSLLKRGDVIEVCGFRYRSQVRALAEAGVPFPPRIHGHLLVMPNGRMQPWGPYGKLNNCVRPSDELQSWLDFLNDDEVARDLWCMPQRTRVPTVAAAKPLADEIDRRLATPCQ